MRMCQYSTIIDFEQWDFVEKGITKLKNILEGQPEQPFNSGDYMIFYTKVFEMCTQKTHSEQLHCSQQLYDKYRDTIQDYITSTVLPSLREKRDEFMLRELVKRWSNHKFMVQCLSKFFGYLDRHYVVQMSLPTVKEVGLICFRDLVYSELSGKVRDGVLSLINHEREGQQIDRTLLKNVLNIFVEIGMGELDYYTDDFEAAMLKETTAYYFRKASNWNLDHSCYYTLKGECLNLEVDRASHCLPPNSEWKLAEKVELAILSAFNFTRERKYDNLKEAKDIFGTDEVFRSSFTEILATCCDNILKKDTSKRLSDISIFETVEAAVKLLPYTCDKDLFAEFHREKLALRLLFDESASDRHERGILTKLKMDFGCEFTSKIERMVTDFTLATENEASFDEYLSNNPNANPGIDLTVTVLTKSFWPSYKSFDLNLPPEMVKCVRLFEKFYQTKTKNRNLTWIYSLGTCHINGNFEQGTIELIVTTYQAAVLLLFNTWDKLSCREIATKLNLSEDDIVRILCSLSCARYKILTKEPETETISPSDVFEFNSKFTDKMRSIKMPLLPTVEKKKVVEVVDKDRRSAIDASIVRIMKSRKVLSHEELVTECVQQLRRKSGYNWFVMESTVELRRKYQLEGDSVKTQLDGDAVRKRIADLITREYLKRDEDNPDLLEYLEDGDVQVRCKSGSLRICYVWCSSRK